MAGIEGKPSIEDGTLLYSLVYNEMDELDALYVIEFLNGQQDLSAVDTHEWLINSLTNKYFWQPGMMRLKQKMLDHLLEYIREKS